MRTAQDVIEKLKQEAPEQTAYFYDWCNYVSVRDKTWALILPDCRGVDPVGGHFRKSFEESQRIEKTVFCTVSGRRGKRRGKYLLLGRWGDGQNVTIIKASTVKKFSFPGCLISYDPESKTVGSVMKTTVLTRL